MGERYVGAIDQGTTGTRFVLFDREGSVVTDEYETHEQYYPQPGWVEHDPVEILENVIAVMRRALSNANIDPGHVEGIGVATQRETTVLWDSDTGEPLHRAIVWQDRRTTDRIEELEERGESTWIRQVTGLEPDPYFSATKLEWLLTKHNCHTLAKQGELSFGTIDAWLLDRLTSEHVTDVTNASRTMLFDIRNCAWHDELLEEFGVPRAVLPDVKPSIDPDGLGVLDEGVVGAEIPITGVLGDQQAALFGQTCFEPGDAKNTYGTGSFLLANTGTTPIESEHGLLTTIAYQREDSQPRYALEGSIFVTGGAIQWLADISLIDDPAESEEVAKSVETTNDVYVVPAFSGLGAPQWDGRARGTIVGLTRGTTRDHIIRATIEGIAFRTRDVVEAIEADAAIEISTLKVDGGAVRNNSLCSIQADMLGAEVVRPVVEETTALGAAYAAGLAAGFWPSLDELRQQWQVDQIFPPGLDPLTADAKYERWGEAVERSRDWANDG